MSASDRLTGDYVFKQSIAPMEGLIQTQEGKYYWQYADGKRLETSMQEVSSILKATFDKPNKDSETDFVCEGVRKYGKVIDTAFPEIPEVYLTQNTDYSHYNAFAPVKPDGAGPVRLGIGDPLEKPTKTSK